MWRDDYWCSALIACIVTCVCVCVCVCVNMLAMRDASCKLSLLTAADEWISFLLPSLIKQRLSGPWRRRRVEGKAATIWASDDWERKAGIGALFDQLAEHEELPTSTCISKDFLRYHRNERTNANRFWEDGMDPTSYYSIEREISSRWAARSASLHLLIFEVVLLPVLVVRRLRASYYVVELIGNVVGIVKSRSNCMVQWFWRDYFDDWIMSDWCKKWIGTPTVSYSMVGNRFCIFQYILSLYNMTI